MSNSAKASNLKIRKRVITAAAALLLAAGSGVGTVAFLKTQSNPVQNEFSPATVSTDIVEEFDGIVKEHVTVKNDSDIPVFVRAALVISWQKLDDSGNWITMDAVPEIEKDYSLVLGTDWKKVGDYYYFIGTVNPGQSTTDLIETCTQNVKGPEGSTLTVDILSQSIQIAPEDAVLEAWGISAADIKGGLGS